jgi:hypothetical protein
MITILPDATRSRTHAGGIFSCAATQRTEVGVIPRCAFSINVDAMVSGAPEFSCTIDPYPHKVLEGFFIGIPDDITQGDAPNGG